jgi:hypothetical protein
MKRRSFLGMFFGGLAALFGFKAAKPPAVRIRTGLELKYPHLPLMGEKKQVWWNPEGPADGPFDFSGVHVSDWKREMVVGAPSENDQLETFLNQTIPWDTLTSHESHS